MDDGDQCSTEMHPFIISTTNQYCQMFTMFAKGVQLIESQLDGINNGQSNLLHNIRDLSETTLNLSKSLNACLLNMHTISKWQQKWKSEPQDLRHLKDTWLRTRTGDLRIYCHRYSLAMLKLACALKKKTAKARKSADGLDDDNQSVDIDESMAGAAIPWTRSNSRIVSQGSSMIAHTPESISSLDLSDEESVENLWQFFGDGTVHGDFIMDGWSESSSRSYSHW